MSSIIADSSGLISLLFPKDSNNKIAVKIGNFLVSSSSRIIIPGDIFTEIVNIVGKKEGHSQAFQVGSRLITSYLYEIIDVTKNLRDKAFMKFKKQPKSVSLTDCIVMAFADEFETKEIFGFDEAFKKNGYIRIGIDEK